MTLKPRHEVRRLACLKRLLVRQYDRDIGAGADSTMPSRRGCYDVPPHAQRRVWESTLIRLITSAWAAAWRGTTLSGAAHRRVERRPGLNASSLPGGVIRGGEPAPK